MRLETPRTRGRTTDYTDSADEKQHIKKICDICGICGSIYRKESADMKKPLLYLDNCCFNRPYDDQSQIRVSLETQAKLFIQRHIEHGKYILAWSFILSSENDDNPYSERKREISRWESLVGIVVRPNDTILRHAQRLRQTFGIRGKDAFHIACALTAGCDYFLTTDDKLIKKTRHLADLLVINPVYFVELMEETDDDENGNSDTL